MTVTLTYGVERNPRTVDNAEGWLEKFATMDEGRGQLYYVLPIVRPEVIAPEDLGVTLLMNSRADGRAFRTVVQKSQTLNLTSLPDVPLETTTARDRQLVASLISIVAGWRGFGASLATKFLHKKRPALIPILDNQAVFGAYMDQH